MSRAACRDTLSSRAKTLTVLHALWTSISVTATTLNGRRCYGLGDNSARPCKESCRAPATNDAPTTIASLGYRLGRIARRVSRARWLRGGVDVIFLGPDGAGKSSAIHKVRGELAGAFSNTRCLMFPPALFRRWRGRAEGPPVLPHDLPPRSPFALACGSRCCA
jgi:hypothetical protein